MSIRETEAYKPEPPSGSPPERARVKIVSGSGSASDDLYLLLLRRLRIFITIAFAYHAFSVLVVSETLLRNIRRVLGGELALTSYQAVSGATFWLTIFVVTGATVLLWKWPPASVGALRRIELVAIGCVAFGTLLTMTNPVRWNFLTTFGQLPEDLRGFVVGSFLVGDSFGWFMIIVIYGTAIPNTWRRGTLVVGVLAVCPISLFGVIGLWFRPIDPSILVQYLLALAFFNGFAVAVVAFSSSRIEILRRQVAEARRLGQYVLKEQLGTGGMGEVYRAEHLLLRRPSAIKVIRPERAGDPKNLRRFEREVQVTATLTHPNTIQIYDYGRAEDGTFYYVMEYLPGQNLEQLVKQHGPLSAERAVHLLRQICGALREAHAVGLIHRDIKPSNVIVCDRGMLHDVAKLLDFGIVDVPDVGPGTEFTAHGQLLGTPAYMSAEQAAGAPDVDARSDLYSLGATAYFMLTGKAPFERTTTNLVIAAHIHDAVTPPHYLRTDIPADLSAVVKRCLEKDPAQRFPDAAGLEEALAACKCSGRWTEERAVQTRQEHANSEEAPRVSTTEMERRWGF